MLESSTGYETNLFVEKPPDEYLCPLCFNVLKDLKQCPNGHCCCGDCFVEALKCRPECPICKIEVTSDKLSRNLFLENTIRNLKMFCISCGDDSNQSLDEAKCTWIGPAALRKSHYESDCGLYKLKCPNLKCAELVSRQILFEHLNTTCLARSVECTDCHTILFAKETNAHELKCPERLINCPNQCGLRSTFRQITLHCDTDCPSQTVDCPLFKLGLCHSKCGVSLLRSNLAQHITNRTIKIKTVLLQASQSVVEIESLKAVNEELEEKLCNLKLIDNQYQNVSTQEDIGHQLITSATLPVLFVDNDSSVNIVHSNHTSFVDSPDSSNTLPIKKYVCVSMRDLVNAITDDIMGEERLSTGPKDRQKIKAMLAQNDRRGIATERKYGELLLYNAFCMICMNVKATPMTFNENAWNALISYCSNIIKGINYGSTATDGFPFQTMPYQEHRENEVARIVVPSVDNIDPDMIYIICLHDFAPEWQSHENLREYFRVDIQDNSGMTLKEVLLDGIVAAIEYNLSNPYRKLQQNFNMLSVSIPGMIKDSANAAALQTLLTVCLGKEVSYKNKKMKWCPGILISLDTTNNQCLVRNKSDEIVVVKLSTNIRLLEYVRVKPSTPAERFVSLKEGDQMEFRNRTTRTWTEVIIKSVDSGNDKLTCGVEMKNKHVLNGVHISDLRKVL